MPCLLPSPGGLNSNAVPPPLPAPLPQVDVDLAGECEGGSAQRVSRQQAQLFLDAGVGHAGGGWRLRCTGRRPLLVNGQTLARGQTVALPTLSHIRIGDISLLFVSNTAAEARAVGRGGALLGA